MQPPFCNLRNSPAYLSPSHLLMHGSVDWDCWRRTEDWYDTQCPGKPYVDLTGIPECARSCFSKENVCKKLTTNCVCSQPKPDCYSTTTGCKSADLRLLEAWYTKSCEYNLTAMTTSFTPSTCTPPSSTESSVSKCLSKGAIGGVAICGAAGALVLGALLCYFWRPGAPGSNGAAALPPGRYGMGVYSKPKVRTGLAPDMVQSGPPFYAPGGDQMTRYAC